MRASLLLALDILDHRYSRGGKVEDEGADISPGTSICKLDHLSRKAFEQELACHAYGPAHRSTRGCLVRAAWKGRLFVGRSIPNKPSSKSTRRMA